MRITRGSRAERSRLATAALCVLLAAGCTAQLTTSEDTEATGEAVDPFASADAGEAGEATEGVGDGDAAQDTPGASADAWLDFTTVTAVTWERHDDAFNYEIVVDGRSHGTAVGDTMFVEEVGVALDSIVVQAFTFDGDPLGEVEPLGAEESERLVLHWDTAAFTEPFVGVRTETNGGSSSLVQSVNEPPHVLAADPAHVVIVLFGESVERAETEGVVINAPFEFDRGEVVEHGPFLELELP